MKSLKVVLLATCVSAFVGCSSKTDSPTNTPASTNKIDMDAPLVKYDGLGKPVQEQSKFSQQDIESKNFVLYKNCYRNADALVGVSAKTISKCVAQAKVCANSSNSSCAGRSGFEGNDRVETLVGAEFNDPSLVTNLFEMVENNLEASSLDDTPWSDDYWGIYKGVLASRYADTEFPQAADWKANFDYSTTLKPVSSVLTADDQQSIDNLSPSEKYDLVIGVDSSSSASLTSDMWRQGKSYYDAHGSVERWMGICHGWAPAAYKIQRPVNPVEVLAADGVTKVKFYQSDIKGLSSYLWATARMPSRFVGGRCNEKGPAKDEESGRIIDQDCFDTNPGTWHAAIVNMIGVKRQSFVLDATYDYEVWNQPVYGYSFTFSNPVTGESTGDVRTTMIPISEYTSDPYKKYRSGDAKFIVNISMKTSYIVENKPSHNSTSSDLVHSVYYNYDLELDDSGKIVGGEWHTNLHPDFLWTPSVDKARVYEDKAIQDEWSTSEGLPDGWKLGALLAAKRGNVLGKIVEQLVKDSQDNE